MNIPKEAITKAIEGGWEPRKYDLGADCEFNEWMHFALDPTFWQCLGKALGWYTPVFNDKHRFSHNHSIYPNWLEVALDFQELILTGGDAKAYWDELLKEEPPQRGS